LAGCCTKFHFLKKNTPNPIIFHHETAHFSQCFTACHSVTNHLWISPKTDFPLSNKKRERLISTSRNEAFPFVSHPIFDSHRPATPPTF
jgi:hypothetical protein